MKYQYLKIVTPGQAALMEGSLDLMEGVGWKIKLLFFFHYTIFRQDFPIPLHKDNKKALIKLFTTHIRKNPWDEKKNEAVKRTIKHIRKNEAMLFISRKLKDEDRE